MGLDACFVAYICVYRNKIAKFNGNELDLVFYVIRFGVAHSVGDLYGVTIALTITGSHGLYSIIRFCWNYCINRTLCNFNNKSAMLITSI